MSGTKDIESQQELVHTSASSQQEKDLSETWAQDALQDLEDFIESQGIHIRQ